MTKFKFRLQTVLEQRERLESQAIVSYAQAKQAIAEAEATMDDLKALLQELIDGITSLRLAGSIDPREQVAYQDYMKTVKSDIATQAIVIESLQQRAEAMRGQLVDASQDRRAIHKMREHKLDSHNLRMQTHELNEADDMSTLRHRLRGTEQAA